MCSAKIYERNSDEEAVDGFSQIFRAVVDIRKKLKIIASGLTVDGMGTVR